MVGARWVPRGGEQAIRARALRVKVCASAACVDSCTGEPPGERDRRLPGPSHLVAVKLSASQPGGPSQGRVSMPTQQPQQTQGIRRRELLKASLATGAALAAWPLAHPPALWSAEAGTPKRG